MFYAITRIYINIYEFILQEGIVLYMVHYELGSQLQITTQKCTSDKNVQPCIKKMADTLIVVLVNTKTAFVLQELVG